MVSANRTFAILCLAAAGLLAGGVQAGAQCCPTVTSEPACPQAATCPQETTCPDQTACPGGVCPAKPAVSLAADLTGLTGCDFDQAYAKQMFDLNADIAALAGLAATNTQDPHLRDYYARIRNSRFEQNRKLARLIQGFCASDVKSDEDRACAIKAQMGTLCGAELDRAYAGMTKSLLGKSASLATTARTRAAFNRLREQANDQAKADARNIFAVDSWLKNGNIDSCLRGQYLAFAR